jgi:hypothetical protein
MRVLRDEFLQLFVALAWPICLAARLTQRILEPRDLMLERADLLSLLKASR